MKTVSITSGKGGVGKTTFVVGIAQSLSAIGKRVLVLDGDLGMANCDVHFGVRCEKNLLNVVRGDCTLRETIVRVNPSLHLVSGGSGLYDLGHLSVFERRTIMDEIDTVLRDYDLVLFDTSPGLHENVLYLNANASANVVVITPDPSSFTDAYALIKVLHQRYRLKSFMIAANCVSSQDEGVALFERFHEVTRRFLNLRLNYVGGVCESETLRRTQTDRSKKKSDFLQVSQNETFLDIGLAVQSDMQGLVQRSDFSVWKELAGSA